MNQMIGMGGPKLPKTEKKAGKAIDLFEAKRARKASRIQKVSPEKGQKIISKISSKREKLLDKLSKLKEKGPIGEYAEGYLNPEREKIKQVQEKMRRLPTAKPAS